MAKTNNSKKNPFFTILCATFIIIISTLIIFSLKKTNLTDLNSINGCVKGGCSGQLCIDEQSETGASTCEWREKYKCYKLATCERQNNGKCGFTSNPQFKKCLFDNL